jgi:hypothetical protein
VRAARRSRLNRLNGSTLLGLALARAVGGRPMQVPDRLWLVEGHRLPLQVTFTVGDVVLHPRPGGLSSRPALLRHERRHAEQYAWCGGLPFLPLYAVAALLSWLLTGDRAAANPFERWAGLADGGYPTGRLSASR